MREIILRLTDEQADELAYATESHAEQHGEDADKHQLTEELDSLVTAAIEQAKKGERIYLALTDTDAGGTGYVVEFESQAAYQRWYEGLEDPEPFGFRGEWGLADEVLTPLGMLEERNEVTPSEEHAAFHERSSLPLPSALCTTCNPVSANQ